MRSHCGQNGSGGLRWRIWPLDGKLTCRFIIKAGQLRDAAGRELQRTRQLARLGQFLGPPGADDRLAMAQDVCEQPVKQLFRDGQDLIVDKVKRNMDLLLGLHDSFYGIEQVMGDIADAQGNKESHMAVVGQLSTTQYLLRGMAGVIHNHNEQSGSTKVRIEPRSLPDSFYSALGDQYGVDYDPVKFTGAVLVEDSARAKLLPVLEEVLRRQGAAAEKYCSL